VIRSFRLITVLLLVGAVMVVAMTVYLYSLHEAAGSAIPVYVYNKYRSQGLLFIRILGYVTLFGLAIIGVRVLEKTYKK